MSERAPWDDHDTDILGELKQAAKALAETEGITLMEAVRRLSEELTP